MESPQEQISPLLLSLIPFSDQHAGPNYPQHKIDFGFTHMAAALLAVDHFNERNPIVVPELLTSKWMQNCSVKLPTPVFANTNTDVRTTSRYLVTVPQNKFSAIVGPYRNDPARTAARFALGLNIPLISHGALFDGLGSPRSYPLTGRTVPQLRAVSEVVISYMIHHGRTDYLATIAPVHEDGNQYRTTMDGAARRANFTRHQLYTYGAARRPEEMFVPNVGIGYAIQNIKEAGFRNIFVAMSSAQKDLPIFAKYAEEFGMNNGEYFWMIDGEVDFTLVANLASRDVTISKFVRGMMAVRCLDGFDANPEHDRMLEAWRSQNASFVDRLNALNPIQDESKVGYFRASSSYFNTHMPQRGAGFMYDAVISVAMGQCMQISQSSTTGNHTQPRVDNELLENIAATKFRGATGDVTFGFHGNTVAERRFAASRLKSSVEYGVYNFRAENHIADSQE